MQRIEFQKQRQFCYIYRSSLFTHSSFPFFVINYSRLSNNQSNKIQLSIGFQSVYPTHSPSIILLDRLVNLAIFKISIFRIVAIFHVLCLYVSHAVRVSTIQKKNVGNINEYDADANENDD